MAYVGKCALKPPGERQTLTRFAESLSGVPGPGELGLGSEKPAACTPEPWKSKQLAACSVPWASSQMLTGAAWLCQEGTCKQCFQG